MGMTDTVPARIACISDTHLFPPEVESEALFPRWVEKLGPVDGPEFYEKCITEVHRAYITALDHIRTEEPDAILHFGDLTGGWRERGLVHPSVVDIAHTTYDELAAIAPTYIAAGNHDTGYHHPMVAGSDISVESVEACEDAYKRLWWECRQQNLHLLGICSPVLEYTGQEKKLLDKQKDQYEFLGDMLQTRKGEPWALCAHTPFLPMDTLGPMLDPHLNTCEAVMHGDLHNPRTAPFYAAMKYVQAMGSGRNNRVQRSLIAKSDLTPSTAPLWWKGYQMRMSTWDGKDLESVNIKLQRPAGSENVPTDSLLKCLVGMLRPHQKQKS